MIALWSVWPDDLSTFPVILSRFLAVLKKRVAT